MKANEFFKSMGIDGVRKFVKHNNIRSGDMLNELKRLVESHDLLDEIDGIDGAKDRVYICEIDDCTSFSLGGYVYEISRVKQAIADVESCQ